MYLRLIIIWFDARYVFIRITHADVQNENDFLVRTFGFVVYVYIYIRATESSAGSIVQMLLLYFVHKGYAPAKQIALCVIIYFI